MSTDPAWETTGGFNVEAVLHLSERANDRRDVISKCSRNSEITKAGQWRAAAGRCAGHGVERSKGAASNVLDAVDGESVSLLFLLASMWRSWSDKAHGRTWRRPLSSFQY